MGCGPWQLPLQQRLPPQTHCLLALHVLASLSVEQSGTHAVSASHLALKLEHWHTNSVTVFLMYPVLQPTIPESNQSPVNLSTPPCTLRYQRRAHGGVDRFTGDWLDSGMVGCNTGYMRNTVTLFVCQCSNFRAKCDALTACVPDCSTLSDASTCNANKQCVWGGNRCCKGSCQGPQPINYGVPLTPWGVQGQSRGFQVQSEDAPEAKAQSSGFTFREGMITGVLGGCVLAVIIAFLKR
eukprot:NODE_203_length_1207_cov_723.443869_g162_i0.p1 GENE.NODE_203_length_1207_cov_723.443869_g162_i0~~NODE_203_length_1207_cov_723.443869_g162_i0.p1  ORF type:complete len:239 (-),score=48.62 NODE_203_length_1207_cov_723.443869_g162_i0:154-870(-)